MIFFHKMGKWMVMVYIAQALFGIGIGVYAVTTMDSAEIERVMNCVVHL